MWIVVKSIGENNGTVSENFCFKLANSPSDEFPTIWHTSDDLFRQFKAYLSSINAFVYLFNDEDPYVCYFRCSKQYLIQEIIDKFKHPHKKIEYFLKRLLIR